jgi:hypothetical protein
LCSNPQKLIERLIRTSVAAKQGPESAQSAFSAFQTLSALGGALSLISQRRPKSVFEEKFNMLDPPRPPDPKPGSKWDWVDANDHGKKKKLGLCHEGWMTCNVPKPQLDSRKGLIGCVINDECDFEDNPSQCWLFHAKKGAKEWEPTPKPQGKWKYDPDYYYTCFCLRVLKDD